MEILGKENLEKDPIEGFNIFFQDERHTGLVYVKTEDEIDLPPKN